MTREEQILNGFTEMMKGFWGNQDLKVPDFEEPCKQEPCEDCVSREKAVITFDDFEELVNKLPSVTPQPKTGHWKDIMVGDMPAQACDRCNTFYPLAYTGGGHKYCPNCGTKMEVSENE